VSFPQRCWPIHLKPLPAHVRRVERLVAALPQRVGAWHRIICQGGQDPAPRMAALIASGEAQEGDNFILIETVRSTRTWD
jgi:hypothetical protein